MRSVPLERSPLDPRTCCVTDDGLARNTAVTAARSIPPTHPTRHAPRHHGRHLTPTRRRGLRAAPPSASDELLLSASRHICASWRPTHSLVRRRALDGVFAQSRDQHPRARRPRLKTRPPSTRSPSTTTTRAPNAARSSRRHTHSASGCTSCRRLAARVSSTAETHKLAGNAKFKAGEYEAAARCYSEAIAVDRTQPTFFTNRAACHRARARAGATRSTTRGRR